MKSIIKLLAQQGPLTGKQLGEQLGITRAAVWKRLQNPSAELKGIVIAQPGAGYMLKPGFNLLDDERLQKSTGKDCKIIVVDYAESTNSAAVELIKSQDYSNFALLAEGQTAGRGRRGREWVTPYAGTMCLSRALPLPGGVASAQGLSLTVGLAVLKALESFSLQGLGLKWPNDIYVNNHKISGILLELAGDLEDRMHVVIGIGINLNITENDSITQAWTSYEKETGDALCRTQFAEVLLECLEQMISLHFDKGFQAIRSEWESYQLWNGQEVVVSSGSKQWIGRQNGVNDKGELLLVSEDGEQFFSGGETSLRLSHDC